MINLGVMSYWVPDSHNIGKNINRDAFFWGLSANLLKQSFPKTKLVTNNIGKYILIDKLELPFDEVDLSLNEFNYTGKIWAAGKLKTYSIQTEPFIHVDHDAFLYRPLSERILKAPLVALHEEFFNKFNKKFYIRYHYKPERILKLNGKIPQIVINHINNNLVLRPYNLGIFGGHDLEFIHLYANESLNSAMAIDWNKEPLFQNEKRYGAEISILFEQFFFGAYATHYAKEVETLHEFEASVFQKILPQFEHLMGWKSDESRIEKTKARLMNLFPQAYKKCNQFQGTLVSLELESTLSLYSKIKGVSL